MRKVNLHIAAAVCVLIMTLAGPARAVTHYVNPGQSIQAAINDANDGDEIEVAPGTYSEDINFNGKAVRLYSSGGPEVTTIGSVLLEDFSDGDYAGWEICDQGNNGAPSVWSAVTGEMVQTSNICTVPLTDPNMLGTYAWWGEGTSWTEYQVTLSMKSDDDDAMGVMFRYQNPNSYYRFAWLKQDHSQPVGRRQLVKIHDGQYAVLDEDDVPYTTGTEYEVKIVVSGPDIEVFIDDVSVLSASDSAITHGSVALYCWGNEGTYFDNIEIMLPVYHHVVQCISGEDANTILEGFTIIGGNANGPDPNDQCGGGMLNFLSSPTVTGCTFRGNTAPRGGGMYNNGSSPTVTYCTFRDNSADIGGGGIYNGNNSSPTVTNCTFTRNSADYGGGMCNINSNSFVVINCNFNDNTADVWGGGMYSNGSSANVANCTFSSNEAVNGGGMFNYNISSPTVTNCTFTGNTASSVNYGGGGMFNQTLSNPIVTNCTFTGNTAAANGGGMYNYNSSRPTVTNCILWGDEPDEISNDATSSAKITYSDIQGGWFGNGNIDADPCFVDAYANNLRLLPSSPCVDAGDNNAPNIPSTDLAGILRVLDGDGDTNAVVDMGAFEVSQVRNVTRNLYYITIQGAIDDANNGDEIGVAPGTYNEAINFKGKAVRLYSSGGADFTTIDANGIAGAYHVVQCVSGENASTILEGFTIIGGNANGPSLYDQCGGGMLNLLSRPTVTGCTFMGNTALRGGGMYNNGSNPTVTNCTFRGNTATANGGGMYNYNSNSPTVTNCTFTGNTASSGTYGGGGMFNHTSSNPIVTNCTFTGNTATANGGGMYNFQNSNPTVTCCTFSGNSAGSGGGMYNNTSNPIVTSCTFTGHTVTANGGGMFNVKSSPKVINCTFSGNSAGSGSGMYNSNTSSPTMTNCILWGDEPDEISNDATSSANVTYSDVQGGWLGTGNIDADPCFVNAAGGDLRLSSSFSPCVDAGDNSVPGLPATDLEGNSRVWDGDGDGNSVVDMGAYELGAPKLIRNKMSQRWYVCIQMAIDDSKDGDEIEVAPGTFYEAINFKGKAVRLYSSDGPEVTTIDGTGHYHVVQCVSGEDANTILEGFTITGGNAKANGHSSDPNYICGGGMYNYNSSPTVTNCTFSGNNAEDYGYGGGMYNEFSSPRVADCTFSSNEAGAGGGMSNNTSSPTVINCTFTGNTNNGMSNNTSSPTVTNCTFTCNTGRGMQNYMYSSPTVTNCTFTGNTGGGMWNGMYSSPKVTNCTFSGNSAYQGGGMYNDYYSSPTVTGCMFIGNTAHYGGGMYVFYESELTVTNCTFSGNSASSGGGIYVDHKIYELTVTNCLFWGDEPDEISKVAGSSAIVTYSDIEGGWTGIGNIDADPCFVDTHNPDPRLRSLRLKPDSPCIDAGDTTAVPDGIFGDVDGNPRGVDYPRAPDTGISIFGVTVDIGAYEFQLCQTPGDINCDGVVDFKDVAILAGNWMAGTERAFIFCTNTDNNGIYSFSELNSNTSYGVSSFARGHISSSEAVMTGASQDNHAPSGKLLGVDFILTHPDCLYVDDDAPGDPNPGDPAVGDPLENGSIEHPFDSIQEAIDAAINGDEIEVAPGTYNEAINFKGKAVRLYGSDGPAVTTIDANGLNSSVVTCKMGEDANTIFEGFTITGGNTDYGGGMCNNGSSPTITNCTFSNNSAETGGGMLNVQSSPTVTNCTFSGNSGGGMANLIGSPKVTGCTFSSNSAGSGGGMLNGGNSSPTVTNCTFSGNTIKYYGGGMYNYTDSSPTVINCTFSSNEAFSGGGMFNNSSSPTMINCTFSGNWAGWECGGLYNENSSPTVTNCIFWGDTPDEFYNYQSNPIVTYSDVAGGWPDANNTNIDADPLFVDVNNPDPNLWNLRLQPDSPCIDAGDTTAVDGIFADADWNLRGLDDPASPDRGVSVSGVTVDMGAYEFQLCRIAGDVNCDGVVNFKDLVVVCDNWLASTEPEL